MTVDRSTLNLAQAEALEARYDPEMSFRPLGSWVRGLIYVTLVGLGIYHYYTAGFGIPREQWHKGIHMGVVLCMIFFVFAARRSSHDAPARNTWWCPGNVPLYDWVLGLAALVSALYIPVTFTGLDVSFLGIELQFEELNYRIGNPNSLDLFFGTVLTVTIFEAARRAMGPVLPLIVGLFVLYALYGSHAPLQVLVIPEVNWSQFLNHVYLTTEGIYGPPIKVISTFVFHFVLFGVIAQRMGLGQFFIDIAQIVAGRFSGGPAKVSVLSSSLFGTISGSSIANTVTTGSLTIPAMKRVGYPGHFAGAVEAASSTGGQITPPIMGAAAFLMVEFLELPYTTIIVAAAVPALMHYIAVFAIVHFEAKRLGLRGLSREEIPRLATVLYQGWPTVIPLIALVWVLFSGYTPYYAAFSGITACIVIGFLNPRHRLTVRDLLDAFYMGSKYALAVGAAGAAVGIVVGVITLTGVTFRLGFMVTQGALGTAEVFHAAFAFLPFELFTIDAATLFISLLYIALACVLMGAGLPTTALYIMLSAIATPALGNLGVPPLAAHLFVLYYGVLADITPPVCTSAYAAGGIAGANPFRTGLTAFKLGNAKVMVPMVFVYSPAMLIVLDDYFTWAEFVATTGTCIVGIVMLGAALTGYLVRPMTMGWRILLAVAAILMVAPDRATNVWAVVLAAPVVIAQIVDRRRARAEARAAVVGGDPPP
ncbi:MAG: TRAP transporter permease [Ectothiorhodospiraceae bacterium]|nr:TRAP transporter permease [Ectothiorhodospiraceae bacterium]